MIVCIGLHSTQLNQDKRDREKEKKKCRKLVIISLQAHAEAHYHGIFLICSIFCLFFQLTGLMHGKKNKTNHPYVVHRVERKLIMKKSDILLFDSLSLQSECGAR